MSDLMFREFVTVEEAWYLKSYPPPDLLKSLGEHYAKESKVKTPEGNLPCFGAPCYPLKEIFEYSLFKSDHAHILGCYVKGTLERKKMVYWDRILEHVEATIVLGPAKSWETLALLFLMKLFLMRILQLLLPYF